MLRITERITIKYRIDAKKENDRDERRAEKRSVEQTRGKLWKRMRDSVGRRSLSTMPTADRVECSQLSVDSLSSVCCDDESIESSIAQVSWQRNEQTCRWHNRGHENVIIQSKLSATIAGVMCLFDWSERRLSKALMSWSDLLFHDDVQHSRHHWRSWRDLCHFISCSSMAIRTRERKEGIQLNTLDPVLDFFPPFSFAFVFFVHVCVCLYVQCVRHSNNRQEGRHKPK